MQQWLLDVWAEQKRTIVFVTHDIDEAIFLADRVMVMSPRPGRIQEILPVPLERPRPMSCLASKTFSTLKGRILELIFADAQTGAATIKEGAPHG
jgi:ABC-type nitrate/sulfonate/bicarbonate transport system ATPase subunit